METQATPNENDLIKSLIWSNQEYSLAQFINEYPLPQVVCTVNGYYGLEEETRFGASQVLALHEVVSTMKLIGTDIFGRAVSIPSKCPTKVEIYPLKSKYMNCTVKDMKSLHSGFSYAKVETTGTEVPACENESIRAGDILEIRKINKKSKSVTFQNMETKQDVILTDASPVTFTLLLDYRHYSIPELKEIYGFPTRVRFVNDGTNLRKTPKTSGSTKSLGEVVLLKETTETVVRSTMVGDGPDEKQCIELPLHLPLSFVVAEGFLKGDGNYQEIVNTLNTNYKITNLADFDQLNVSEHLNAVGKHDHTAPPRPLPKIQRQFPWSTQRVSLKGFPAPSLAPRRRSKPDKAITQSHSVSFKSREKTSENFTSKTPQQSTSWFGEPDQQCHGIKATLREAVHYEFPFEENSEDSYSYVEMEGLHKLNMHEYAKIDGSDKHDKTNLNARPRSPQIASYEQANSLSYDEMASHLYTQQPTTRDSGGTLDPYPSKPSHTPSCDTQQPKSSTSEESQDRHNFPILPQTPSSVSQQHETKTSERTQDSHNVLTRLHTPSSDSQKLRISTSERDQNVHKLPTPSQAPSSHSQQPKTNNPERNASVHDPSKPCHTTTGDISEEVRRLLYDENEDNHKRVSLIPQDLSVLTIDDVCHILRCLNMGAYVTKFEEEMIDGPIMKDLDPESLESLNVTSFHAKKLMKFINGWRPRR